MPIKILMPSLSPTMEDGTLAKWVKKEGDKVKSGDILAEIETDKATIEYESTEDGILAKIIVSDNTSGVAINQLIAVLLEEGESADGLEEFIKNNSESKAVESSSAPTKINTTQAPTEVKQEVPQASSPVSSSITSVKNTVATTNGKIFITPLAKRIAIEKNINISQIQGSGPHGRIIKADLENVQTKTATNTNVFYTDTSPSSYEDKANTGMRKIIAARLLESKITIPHYYLTIECNMEQLLASRKTLNIKGIDSYKLSVNDFIIKAVAMAMQDIPEANAYWQNEVTRFFTNSDISIAVATPTGLITPIIRAADKKGLVQISTEMKALAKKARDGKLKPSEYQGGGFTISNLGMFGVKEFIAIINPPQAGILAIGATEQKAIVKNGNIIVADIMSITLSADHRILDGAVGAKFITAVKGYIENPITMFM